MIVSLVWSLAQMRKLYRYGSGREFMASSSKAFSLMRRSFVAIWFACASSLALALDWKVLSFALCLMVGVLGAYGLEVLTKSSGLLSFIEAGEEAMTARHARIRQECAPTSLFLVQSNGKECAPKIVPERRDWNQLLQVRAGAARSSAS